jgi:transposase-like protein
MADKKNITPKQHKAIEALLSGATRAAAANAAGINDRTLYKWLQDETFTAELRRAENQAITNAQGALIGRIEENLQILDEIKRSKTATDNARIRAVQLQLETFLSWRAALITEERINDIEKRLEGLGL